MKLSLIGLGYLQRGTDSLYPTIGAFKQSSAFRQTAIG